MDVRYWCDTCHKLSRPTPVLAGTVKCKKCGLVMTLATPEQTAAARLGAAAPATPPAVAAAPPAEPVLVALPLPEAPPPRLLPLAALGVAVLLFGLAVAVAVSARKADVTFLGMLGYVAACGAVTAAAAWRASKLATTARYAAAVAAGAMLVPAVGVTLAEAAGPPEGRIVAYQIAKAKEQEQATADDIARANAAAAAEVVRLAEVARQAQLVAAAEAAKKARDEAAFEQARWRKADFVLANPDNRVVGLKAYDGGLEVTAVADAGDARSRLAECWTEKVSVVADPDLARRLADRYKPGEAVGAEDRATVLGVVRAWRMVPPEPKLFTYTPKGERRPRVGHLLHEGGGRYVVCPLVPRPARNSPTADPAGRYVAEAVAADAVAPGSARVIGAGEVEKLAELIERWHYEIAGTLQRQANDAPGLAVRPVVFIDGATLPESLVNGRLAALKSEINTLEVRRAEGIAAALGENQASDLYGSGGLGVLMAGMASAMQEARAAANQRAGAAALAGGFQKVIDSLQKEHDDMRDLIAAGGQVTGDFRRHFVASGFTVIDRSPQAKAAYYKLFGDPAFGRPDALTAVADGLVQATHILLTEVAPAEADGFYHVAMRLVDVKTSRIVWDKKADRIDPKAPERLRYTDLNGTWTAADGTRLKLGSTKKELTAELLGGHPDWEALTLAADRALDKLAVTNCTQVVRRKQFGQSRDAVQPKKEFTTVATVELTNPDELRVVVPWHDYFPATKVWRPAKQSRVLVFKRDAEVAASAPE